MNAYLQILLSFCKYYIYNILVYLQITMMHCWYANNKLKPHQKQRICAETYIILYFFNAYISFLQYIFLIFFPLRKATKQSLHVFKLTTIFSWEWNFFFFDFFVSVTPAWRLKISSKRTLVFAFASLSTAKRNLEYDSLAQ